jgi:hypothetical protein
LACFAKEDKLVVVFLESYVHLTPATCSAGEALPWPPEMSPNRGVHLPSPASRVSGTTLDHTPPTRLPPTVELGWLVVGAESSHHGAFINLSEFIRDDLLLSNLK